MKPSRKREVAFDGLRELARAELSGEMSSETSRAMRERVVDAAVRERALGGARSGWRAGAGVVVVAAVAALAFLVVRPGRDVVALSQLDAERRLPLAFFANEGGAGDKSFVASSPAGATLAFSEGTKIAFDPNSEGRVANVGPHGSRVIVTDGKARFDVTHRDGTAWAVEAGPYVVRVTGTSFSVDWRPKSKELEVTMFEGSVVIDGPSAHRVSLVKGQVFHAEDDGAFRVGKLDAAPVPVPALPEVRTPAPSASVAVVSSYADRMKTADYRGIVDDVVAKGADAVMGSVSLDDLVAIADAARYVGRVDLARSALSAQRSRFSGSQAARTATFLLGRLAEDADGSPKKAIALYDEYLAGGGPFASEALGRKMVATERAEGRVAAARVAGEYLSRFPNGGYASAARALVDDVGAASPGEAPTP